MDVYAAREDPVPGVSGALVADRIDDRVQTLYVPVVVRRPRRPWRPSCDPVTS